MLVLKETVDGLAKANEVRWHRHMQRRDDNVNYESCLNLEVSGNRKQG